MGYFLGRIADAAANVFDRRRDERSDPAPTDPLQSISLEGWRCQKISFSLLGGFGGGPLLQRLDDLLPGRSRRTKTRSADRVAGDGWPGPPKARVCVCVYVCLPLDDGEQKACIDWLAGDA